MRVTILDNQLDGHYLRHYDGNTTKATTLYACKVIPPVEVEVGTGIATGVGDGGGSPER